MGTLPAAPDVRLTGRQIDRRRPSCGPRPAGRICRHPHIVWGLERSYIPSSLWGVPCQTSRSICIATNSLVGAELLLKISTLTVMLHRAASNFQQRSESLNCCVRQGQTMSHSSANLTLRDMLAQAGDTCSINTIQWPGICPSIEHLRASQQASSSAC